MSDLEGRLDIALRCADGAVAEVAICNHRMTQAGRMFVGRRPGEVAAMLPLLFSLCGHAQLVAGLEALEQASGLVPDPATLAARRLMVTAETVLEQAQSVLRDWPALLGEAPDMVAARGLRAALGSLRGALYPDRDWARLGGGTLRPDADDLTRRLNEARRLIETAIFAGPAGYELGDLRNWSDWARTGATAAARLVRDIEDRDLGGLGAGPVPLLPALDRATLEARLAADDGAFLARPDWQDMPHLTHPLGRRASHPVVSAMLLTHGTGVLTLIAARLADLQAGLEEAEGLKNVLGAWASGPPQRLGGQDARAPGNGLGLVEAARGLLVHRVELDNDVIARYQILAPTEWNFHPQGALVHGLLGLADGDGLEAQARLLVAALDPCVACTITIETEMVGHSDRNMPGCDPKAGRYPTDLVG